MVAVYSLQGPTLRSGRCGLWRFLEPGRTTVSLLGGKILAFEAKIQNSTRVVCFLSVQLNKSNKFAALSSVRTQRVEMDYGFIPGLSCYHGITALSHKDRNDFASEKPSCEGGRAVFGQNSFILHAKPSYKRPALLVGRPRFKEASKRVSLV